MQYYELMTDLFIGIMEQDSLVWHKLGGPTYPQNRLLIREYIDGSPVLKTIIDQLADMDATIAEHVIYMVDRYFVDEWIENMRSVGYDL